MLQLMKKTLWTYREVKRAVGVDTHGQDFDIYGVSIDSRKVSKGDLFIALKVERDGHDFVKAAYENGAVAAIVSHEVDCDIPQIVVKDTYKALWAMADAQRDWSETTRIAITGSCGKTTTKELMAAALSAHKSEGSYNNHWGVPLTLTRMPRESKFGVFEIGMNHPGEILPLAELVQPKIAVVTNIKPVHVEAFDSLGDVAIEKLSIVNGLIKGGTLVTSYEVYEDYKQYFDRKPLTYSLNNTDADVYVEAATKGVDRQTIVASVCGEPVTYLLRLHGDHAVEDSLAVLATAKTLGLNVRHAASGMEMVTPVIGRGNIYEINDIFIVDESYNANPASMEAALTTLTNRTGVGRKVAILGEMLELGEGSVNYHEDLARHCREIDTVITVGENMKHLQDALPAGKQGGHFERQDKVNIQKLINQLQAGDMVMVKGSNGTFWKYDFVPRLVKTLEQMKTEDVSKGAA